MTQKQVQIAAGMYEARDTVKRMTTPEGFKEKVAEYRAVIEEVMSQDTTSVLPATLSLIKQVRGDHFFKMWLVATAVEMIEPSV